MQQNNHVMDLTEQGYVPDSVIRLGIRRLIKQRLSEIEAGDAEAMADSQYQFIQSMYNSVIAPLPEKANQQHYEVPADFFKYALGAHRKYSSCLWKQDTTDLNTAEQEALKDTCVHAHLSNDMDILELGCGWGSLTLWMAEQYPQSKITAVSNSNSQREYILKTAQERALDNIEIITCDMNEFSTEQKFDRVVSVEMFEHMRNYPQLFKSIHDWLRPGGKFFMHIFVHRAVPYAFEAKDASDWMSEHFFSGGIMPSDDLPLFFQQDLKFLRRWRWDGTHYQKTARAWLENMDAHKDEVWKIMENTYAVRKCSTMVDALAHVFHGL